MTSGIKASGLCKWFGQGEARTYAVREVSFEASYGEMLYVVGPSGSGKTTLLSMISGILRPDKGTVEACGEDLWALPENKLADFRLNKIGFVFQDFHLFPRLTTAENVALPLILKRKNWKRSLEDAEKYLDVVGLATKASLPPTKLSGGEQQRVAIARAIASDPELMIFDEPTASLDGDTGKKILEFVRSHVLGERRCIVIVTHDNRIYEYADRIVKMEDGHIQAIEKGDVAHA